MTNNNLPIPQQLWNENFRFLKIIKGDKKPTPDMSKWQEQNYKFNDTELLNHIQKGGSYGVIGGYGNLIIIDSDSEETTKICEEKLPQTFTVKSGSKEWYKKHYFFILDKKVKGIRISKEHQGDLGDIRATGQYVVGPNCLHKSGNYYKVEKDLPIERTTQEKLKEVFEGLLEDKDKENSEKEFPADTKKRDSKYIRKCQVPDYLLENKLPENTSKNWKLFPYVVDILYNRSVNDSIYTKLSQTQGHNLGAIKGWVNYAKEGKIEKSSCNKMRDYLNRFHPDLADKICEGCPLFENIKKKREIKQRKDLTQLQKDVLLYITARQKDSATEKIVNEIENNEYIYTTRDDQKTEMWIYNEGIYVPQGKSYVKEFCRKILDKAFTTNICNQVIAKIEADSFIEQEKFFNSVNKEEVPVQNGVLNLITRELKEFDPKKIFFNKLPVIYDPYAECKQIDKFLDDVLSDTEDKKVFYEIAGFGLYKEYFIEKAIMMVGAGRNGKGKSIELLKRLVGPENCASVPLSSMKTDSFRIAELFGNLFNLAGDLNSNDLKQTGTFKELTGRDFVSAPRKFLSSISFVNYAKMVFACNKLPRVYDVSTGFWSRWILLEFPYKFVEKDVYENANEEDKKFMKIKDNHIIDKITEEEELSGLLNKAINGLNNLLKNEKFSYSQGVDEVKRKWIRKSDSFMAFCMDNLKEDPEGKISKQKLRRVYSKYCKDHKVQGVSDKSIKATLQEMFGVMEEFSSINDETTGGFTKQEWCWLGIGFK